VGTPLFEIAGLGVPIVWAAVVLTVLGVAFGIRGFWGGDRRSRRLALAAAILTLSIAFVAGSFVLLEGFQMIARLGPAATPADVARVWRRALSPAMVGVASFTLIAMVSAIGWAVEKAEPEPVNPLRPPRRPVR
jgi:hypothetical protein